jgi:hypothetical protein
MDRINYNCSENKPIAEKTLLHLIPEIYNDKLSKDFAKSNNAKVSFDEFFINYFTEKYGIKKLIKKNTESTLLAILSNSKLDNRIALFGRFLGLRGIPINKHILDIYLNILKLLPISFYKLFTDPGYKDFIMDTSLCFEIYRKYPYYNFGNNSKDILAKTIVLKGNEEHVVSEENKDDYFALNNFHDKSFMLVADIFTDYKAGKLYFPDIDKLIEALVSSNADLSDKLASDILHRTFTINENGLDLKCFLSHFNNKFSFKIKIVQFLDLTVNSLINLFNRIENRINDLFKEVKANEVIDFKTFETIMMKIIPKLEYNWHIKDLYK